MAGIILTFLTLLIISKANDDHNLKLYDHPQQTIEASHGLEVFQVLPNGNALAYVRQGNFDTIVALLLADQNVSYYDDQQIGIPQGKCLKQVGTYQYPNKEGFVKTVPVVEILDK